MQAETVHRGGASPPAATEASPALALIAAVKAQEARAKERGFVPEDGGCPVVQEEVQEEGEQVQAQEQAKGRAKRADQTSSATPSVTVAKSVTPSPSKSATMGIESRSPKEQLGCVPLS